MDETRMELPSVKKSAQPGGAKSSSALQRLRDNLLQRQQLAFQAGLRDLENTFQLFTELVNNVDQSASEGKPAVDESEVVGFIEAQIASLDADPSDLQLPEQIRELVADCWGELLGGHGSGAVSAAPDEFESYEESPPPEQNDEVLQDREIALLLSVLGQAKPAAAAQKVGTISKSPAPGEVFEAKEKAVQQDTQNSRRELPQAPTEWTIPAELKNCAELREAFLDDAQRCLADMEAIAMEAGSRGNHAEHSRAFCRQLHTIKGAAASVGLNPLARYAHEVEELLQDSAKSGAVAVDGQLLLSAVDSVRHQIMVLEGKEPLPATPAAPLVASAPVKEKKHKEESRPGPAARPSSDPASSSNGGDRSVRVRAQQLDRLMDMLAELVAMRNRRDARAGELKRLAEEMERCSVRLRRMGDPEMGIAGSAGSVRPGVGDSPMRYMQHSGQNSLEELVFDIGLIASELQDWSRPLNEENAALTLFIRHFRQELIQLRRLPVSGLFQRLKRAIHDAARLESKQVEIRFEGEDTGLEQSLQDRLFEPLLHMVRNSVSHGIETPDVRLSAGKSAPGTITLGAQASASMLTITVSDDGNGLDYDAIRRRGFERGLLMPGTSPTKQQLAKLIFHPGFSTRDTASEVSGRGVGMDVVATTIDRLQGRIEVDSVAGAGTHVRLSIPLTTGIEHVMVFRAASQLFALPMRSIEAANRSPGGSMRMVAIDEALGHAGPRPNTGRLETLFLDDKLGLGVEKVVGPEEAVVRPLPEMLRRHPLVSGVVLTAGGEIVLLLNAERTREWCAGAADEIQRSGDRQVVAERHAGNPFPSETPPRALVVDDSVSARLTTRRRLEQRGFMVKEAGDGMAALMCLKSENYDLVVTDIDMPRMDGLELVAEMIRANLDGVEIIVSSAREENDVTPRLNGHRIAGYLQKPVRPETFDELLRTLQCSAAIV
jgi:chemosensory pili system protein ChpA (sensor histidine kinase/response regulator)